jgi:hypothetical protein
MNNDIKAYSLTLGGQEIGTATDFDFEIDKTEFEQEIPSFKDMKFEGSFEVDISPESYKWLERMGMNRKRFKQYKKDCRLYKKLNRRKGPPVIYGKKGYNKIKRLIVNL